jgi:hypothetical protein
MPFQNRLLSFMIALTCPVLALAAAPQSTAVKPSIGIREIPSALTKPEVITKLKTLQEKQTQALDANDKSMKKLLQESQGIRIDGNDQILSERQLQSLNKRLTALVAEKDELQMRYDFIGQLIFQVDSKWSSQPLATFLEQQLLDMAVTDLNSASAPGKPALWRFYTYLSIAIREIPEKREDLVAFLDGYLEYSSIQQPKSPAQYLNTRQYTNGAVNQTARPVNRDTLEATVDKKLKALETIGVVNPTATPIESADSIELRTRVPNQQSR